MGGGLAAGALARPPRAPRGGRDWPADRAVDDPNVVRAIIRRLAQTELDGGNLDVAAVAALARCVNARMLRDVLPGVDPEEAEAWLRSRSFAEPLRDGVTLHDLVRRAVRSDLRRRDPEHERELRRRIADHLHARALRGEPRLVVDLAELLENPALRWGFGADGSVRYRVDEVREGDTVAAAPQVAARSNNGEQWWHLTEPFFLQAPDRVCVVRDPRREPLRVLHQRLAARRARGRRGRPAASARGWSTRGASTPARRCCCGATRSTSPPATRAT